MAVMMSPSPTVDTERSQPKRATWVLQPIVSRQNWQISLQEPDLKHKPSFHISHLRDQSLFIIFWQSLERGPWALRILQSLKAGPGRFQIEATNVIYNSSAWCFGRKAFHLKQFSVKHQKETVTTLALLQRALWLV